jgi:uncharacterized protein (TIGR02145 family)
MFVGGYFTSFSGVSANRIIKLKSTGKIDFSFTGGTGFDNLVLGFSRISGETSFYVFGQFSSYKGISANKIIKLNLNGTIDNSFTGGTGFNGTTIYSPHSIIWTNKLLITGNFTSYNGTPSLGYIILNSDGTIFQSFTTDYEVMFTIGDKLYGSEPNSYLKLIMTYVTPTPTPTPTQTPTNTPTSTLTPTQTPTNTETPTPTPTPTNEELPTPTPTPTNTSTPTQTPTKTQTPTPTLTRTPLPPTEVLIGTQIWATENLDVETYRDGTLIPQATTNADWLSKTYNGIGAWCYYDNDPVNGATYGKLYNWGAVNNTANGGLAPLGYHVPTYTEFNVLVTFLGPNSSGFASLQKGGGYRHLDDGSFNGINASGNWWSSTEFNSFLVWTMFNDTGSLTLSTWYKQGGMSVRLIKD